MRTGELIRFDHAPYASLHTLQHEAVEVVAAKSSKEKLFLGTHRPVITLGRSTDRRNILSPPGELEIVEIERGGDVTYHGPGQLVGYPIIDLNRVAEGGGKRDLHRFLRDLEEIQIEALATLGIVAGRKEGLTGVWVKNGTRKIASIGIAVRKWVTYHGFALNIDTDLKYFSLLNPCGLDASIMTSVSRELGVKTETEKLVLPVLAAFEKVLGIQFQSS